MIIVNKIMKSKFCINSTTSF